ncbi:MAG: carbohydrate binding family 9 domain-containing protein [Bacteroidetes bacterium]|nr:carbohydrate binding family 9 domain-containing protein [Bacteroidota bacterium]
MSRKTLLLAVLVFASSPLLASERQDSTNSSRFVIKAIKIDGSITLTGRLTDPNWKLAPRAELDYEIQPGDNTPAPQSTTAMVLYDSQYLYFGFICRDTNPSHIRAHVTDRDNIFQDDFAGVILDTYRDHQRAYEFFVNPYGIQADLMRTGNNEDASWDAVWYSKAAINDSGYTVEMAIPFKSLRFPSSKVQNWGLEMFRNLPRDSRVQISWVRLNLNDPCILCQAGTLEGLKGLQSIGSLEVLPYAMGVESGGINNAGDPESHFSDGPVRGRIGGGLKYSPNPSMSFEGVINPDFSQVESDAAQISVNNTFALFYPEKRPFFMDGNDILSTVIQAYYSRMINDPMGAGKVVEKSGPWSVAYLAAEDRNSPFIIAGEEGSVSDNNGDNTFVTPFRSFSNILRARYNFGAQSFVGVLGTARNFTNAHNYVGGVDWNLFFSGNYTFDGQVLLSNTRELNDTNLVSDPTYFGNTRFTKAFDGQEYDGTGFQTDFRRDARHYSFRLTYKDVSPTFQAEDGYVFSNDLRTVDMEHSLFFYPNTSLVDNWGVDLESGLHFDYQGSRKERWVVPTFILNLKSQTQFTVSYFLVNDELFHSVNFTRVNRWQFNLTTNPMSSLTFSLNASVGEFIYREDQPELGNGHNIGAELVLRPTDRLTMTIDYARSRLSNIANGELLFDGYISRVEGVYQFSDRVFVRLIGQYDQFNRQIEVDPLFSYKLNPFTIFYAGSTHSMQDYGRPYGVVQTAREFFVKLQYLWRN